MAAGQIKTFSMFGVLSLKIWLDDEESVGPQWGSWNIPGLDKIWYVNIKINFLFMRREGHITIY